METYTDNPKSEAVRRDLLEALLLLMNQQKFQDISITALCGKAGVSRMAFYRNFNYKEDILLAHLDGLFDQYLAELSALEPDGVYEVALRFFHYFQGQKRFLKLLIKAEKQTMLLECFDRYLQELSAALFKVPLAGPEETFYQLQFASGGLYKILMAWIGASSAPPPQAMAGIVAGLLTPPSKKG